MYTIKNLDSAAESASGSKINSTLKDAVDQGIIKAKQMLDLAKNDLVKNVVIFIIIQNIL